MRAMRKTVAENDVSHWASAFLTELTTTRPPHDKHVRPARGG
jgi:trehalose 6-phosphate synthase